MEPILFHPDTAFNIQLRCCDCIVPFTENDDKRTCGPECQQHTNNDRALYYILIKRRFVPIKYFSHFKLC